MNKILEVEAKIVDLEGYIEKADYLAEQLVNNYELDEEMSRDPIDALAFAMERKRIGQGIDIIRDYISNINCTVSDIRKAVLA